MNTVINRNVIVETLCCLQVRCFVLISLTNDIVIQFEVNLYLCIYLKRAKEGLYQTYDDESFFPLLFDLMMAPQSTETHSITLKYLALFRIKLRNSCSICEICELLLLRYNWIEFSIRVKN